jgi:hypothetical protein
MRLRRVTRTILVVTSVLATLLLPAPAQAVVPVWTTLMQGPDTGYPTASVTHGDATYVLLDGMHNAREVCRLARVDAVGEVEWIRRVASDRKPMNCSDLAAGDTGLYLAISAIGRLDGIPGGGGWDAYVRKLDDDGAELWTREFGTAGMELGTTVAATGDSVALGGYTYASTPTYDADAFVKTYDRDGGLLWSRRIRSDQDEIVWDIAADTTGVYAGVAYLSGEERITIKRFGVDGARGWTWSLGSVPGELGGMVAPGGGRLLVGGSTAVELPDGTDPIGPRNVFLALIDTTTGAPAWIRQFGTDVGATTTGVGAGPAGVYVTGYTAGSLTRFENHGNLDAFVRSYDVDGHRRWTRQFGTHADDLTTEVSTDATGVISVGVTRGNLGGYVEYQATFVRRWEPA